MYDRFGSATVLAVGRKADFERVLNVLFAPKGAVAAIGLRGSILFAGLGFPNLRRLEVGRE